MTLLTRSVSSLSDSLSDAMAMRMMGEASASAFSDLRLVLHVLGKLAGDAGHGIAHVHGGGLKVGVAGKLDRDAARSIGRRGGDAGHALHARDGAFDDGGDLGVDAFGRGAGVVGAHRYDGAVDVGQLADLDRLQRGDAGDDDEKVQHRGQDGAANEYAHPSAIILVRGACGQFRLGASWGRSRFEFGEADSGDQRGPVADCGPASAGERAHRLLSGAAAAAFLDHDLVAGS